MRCSAQLLLAVQVIIMQAHVLQAAAQDERSTDRNVSCVITQKSWIEPDRLTVRWRIPEATNASDVTVQWFSEYNMGACSQWNATSCTCRYGDANCMDFRSLFDIHVTAGDRSYKFSVDADMCRKPPRLDTVEVHAENSTCVNVTWHYDVTESTFCSDRDERVYQISYRAGSDADWKYVSIDKTHSCSSRSVLCGLTPFTQYEVAVRTKFTNFTEQPIGHWSDLTGGTVKTFQSVPTGAPTLVLGGYAHVREDCLSDVRTVRLYWQRLDPKDRNGIITVYHVSVFLLAGSTRTLHRELQTPGTSVSVDLDLHCSGIYSVVVAAATEVGLSNYVAYTVIPNITNGILSEVVDVIPLVTGTSSLTVLWKLRQAVADNGTSIVVIWCQKSSTADCEESPTWRTLSSESTQLTITPSSSQPMHHYMVGVSVGSRGITWTTCQFAPEKEPPRPVGVSVRPVGPDALSVSWENSPCEARTPYGPYVDHFIIQLCPVLAENDRNCSGTVIAEKVDHDEASFTKYDLDPEVIYKLNVIAVGRDNVISQPSIDVYMTVPVVKGVFIKDWMIILISLGSVGAIGVAVCFVVKFARNVRRRAAKKGQVKDIMSEDLELANLREVDG